MRGAYLVLRGGVFHFRIRVPNDLLKFFQQRELHVSLAESRCREAHLKASVAAFETRRFFTQLRQAVKTHGDDQIRATVTQWLARVMAKDSDLRLKFQSLSRPIPGYDYESHRVWAGALFDDLLSNTTVSRPIVRLAPTPALVPEVAALQRSVRTFSAQ